jgi:sulfotransferase
MDKTFHFMAGLPRSGSTVLAALLNQHPDIYASPQTELLGLVYEAHSHIPNYESYKAGLLRDGYLSVLNGIPNLFYSNIEKPVVIDKNRGWGTPYNFEELSPYLNPEGKVILTLRPILEVLASFVKIINKNEKLYGDTKYFDQELWVSHYRNKKDAQAEYLMQLNGEIDRAIFSISNLLKNYRNRVHVVWFNDLFDSPQKTLSGIYEFLELDDFKNNFNKISEVDRHDDFSGYGLSGLHDIKSKLKKPSTKPEDFLSDYIIQKYKSSLDFLDF